MPINDDDFVLIEAPDGTSYKTKVSTLADKGQSDFSDHYLLVNTPTWESKKVKASNIDAVPDDHWFLVEQDGQSYRTSATLFKEMSVIDDTPVIAQTIPIAAQLDGYFGYTNGIVFAGEKVNYQYRLQRVNSTTYAALSTGAFFNDNTGYSMNYKSMYGAGGTIATSDLSGNVYSSTNGGTSWSRVQVTSHSLSNSVYHDGYRFHLAYEEALNQDPPVRLKIGTNGTTWTDLGKGHGEHLVSNAAGTVKVCGKDKKVSLWAVYNSLNSSTYTTLLEGRQTAYSSEIYALGGYFYYSYGRKIYKVSADYASVSDLTNHIEQTSLLPARIQNRQFQETYTFTNGVQYAGGGTDSQGMVWFTCLGVSGEPRFVVYQRYGQDTWGYVSIDPSTYYVTYNPDKDQMLSARQFGREIYAYDLKS